MSVAPAAGGFFTVMDSLMPPGSTTYPRSVSGNTSGYVAVESLTVRAAGRAPCKAIETGVPPWFSVTSAASSACSANSGCKPWRAGLALVEPASWASRVSTARHTPWPSRTLTGTWDSTTVRVPSVLVYSTDFSERPTSFEVFASNREPVCAPPAPVPINGRKSPAGLAGASCRSGPAGVCTSGTSRGSIRFGAGAAAACGDTTASADDTPTATATTTAVTEHIQPPPHAAVRRRHDENPRQPLQSHAGPRRPARSQRRESSAINNKSE